jgi:D-ribose pyranase
MKKTGILNPALSTLLARTGHTDYFMICDKGYPVPDDPERIDLALIEGIPTVIDVLRAVHAEYHIDRIVIAAEMAEISPGRLEELRSLLGEIRIETMPHLQLKNLAATGKATVRTGDPIPYSNLIVVSG